MIFLPSTEGKIFNCLTKYQEGFLEVWCRELPGAFSCLWTHAELSFTGSAQEHVDRLDENISCVFSQLAFNCCDSSWFPLPFLCLQQVCAISFPLFNWKCLIKLASIFFFLNLTQLSVIHKSLGLGLLFTCYLFMPATCKLWRCSYKSVARHLDSCQEGNWLCLPTLALPAVLLNVHKTQPKPNKAHIPQASTFFFFLSLPLLRRGRS